MLKHLNRLLHSDLDKPRVPTLHDIVRLRAFDILVLLLHPHEVGGALLIHDDEPLLVLEHLPGQLEALDTLQLRIHWLALHSRNVLEHSLVHLCLCQLKAVLMGDLLLEKAFRRHLLEARIDLKQLQNLERLPYFLLLL